MARDGSGNYSRTQSDYVFDTIIDETKINSELNDFATEMTNSIDKDGQTTWTGNQNCGSKKLTSLTTGSARTDSIRLDQVQDSGVTWGGTGGGTADVITLSLTPAITAYATGMIIRFLASGANTTVVTVNVNSVGAKAIKKSGGTALVANDIQAAGALVEITYDGTNFELLNLAPPAGQTDAEIKTAYENNADTNEFDDAEQTKLAGISTAAEVNPAVVSQVDAEAGTATDERIWTAERVKQAIAALETGVAAGEVGQGELGTTTGDLTTSVGDVLATGPGGEYGFWPTVKSSDTTLVGVICSPLTEQDAVSAGVTYNLTATLVNRVVMGISNGAKTLTVRQRYVQASPPYFLGPVLVPTFIFALVENVTGDILAMYQAADPPWANNGPTSIRPDRIDANGVGFKTVRTRKPLTNVNDPDFWTDTEFEITNDYKNSDMGLIPHPFIGNDLTGKTVVMVDPRMKLVERLHEMIEAGEEPLTLFHDGDIAVGNTDIPALTRPNGVLVVTATLR